MAGLGPAMDVLLLDAYELVNLSRSQTVAAIRYICARYGLRVS